LNGVTGKRKAVSSYPQCSARHSQSKSKSQSQPAFDVNLTKLKVTRHALLLAAESAAGWHCWCMCCGVWLSAWTLV